MNRSNSGSGAGAQAIFEQLEPRLLLSGAIQGAVWNDVNGNGIRDAGEPGLTGRTVFLDLDRDGEIDAGESTTTGANGSYGFTGLTAGTYRVADVAEAGWTRTSPAHPEVYQIPPAALQGEAFAKTSGAASSVVTSVTPDGDLACTIQVRDSSLSIGDAWEMSPALGLGWDHTLGHWSSLNAYDAYELTVTYVSGPAGGDLNLKAYLNTGLTGPSGYPTNDPTNNTWWGGVTQSVSVGQTVTLRLDFDYAQAYSIMDNKEPHSGYDIENRSDGMWTAINDRDRHELSNIGLGVDSSWGGTPPARTVVLNVKAMPVGNNAVVVPSGGTVSDVNFGYWSLNQPPTVADFAKRLAKGATLTFAASDFSGAFSDPDAGDSLQKITITSLPSHGTLKLGTAPVIVNQEIPVSQLGRLSYKPASKYAGTDSFGWTGSDGSLYAAPGALVNLTIEAVPPTVSSFSKAGASNTTFTFTALEFTQHFADTDAGDTLQKVKITKLPRRGALKLNGVAVVANQEIPVEQLGNLTYRPNTGYKGSDSFSWVGSDGVWYAITAALVNLTVN